MRVKSVLTPDDWGDEWEGGKGTHWSEVGPIKPTGLDCIYCCWEESAIFLWHDIYIYIWLMLRLCLMQDAHGNPDLKNIFGRAPSVHAPILTQSPTGGSHFSCPTNLDYLDSVAAALIWVGHTNTCSLNVDSCKQLFIIPPLLLFLTNSFANSKCGPPKWVRLTYSSVWPHTLHFLHYVQLGFTNSCRLDMCSVARVDN